MIGVGERDPAPFGCIENAVSLFFSEKWGDFMSPATFTSEAVWELLSLFKFKAEKEFNRRNTPVF
jgi:hypothetical protein